MTKMLNNALAALAFMAMLPAVGWTQMSPTQMIDEVYGPNYFAGNPDLEQFFHTLILERIHYKEVSIAEESKYRNVNDAPMMNKYNPSLQADAAYDPNTFNPLRYQLDFYSKTTLIYRIDAMNIMIIDPQ